MKLDVNPTRMELLRLKRRTQLAKKGHKLLKDKQEELIRRMLHLITKVKELMEKVEEELKITLERFQLAYATMGREEVENALLLPSKKIEIETKTKRFLNIKIPLLTEKVSGKIYSYGMAFTSCELDVALVSMDKVIKDMIKLAELNKMLELLAEEINKTRRRVNALEYILIPNLEETVKYIQMKLSEMERSDLSRLMKIKEIVRKH